MWETDKNWYQLCYFLVTHWVIIDPSSTLDKVHWSSSFLSSTYICSSLVMDRQGISSPVFHDNDNANNYITKTSIFRLQRAMQGIERLAIDIRQNEARKKGLLWHQVGRTHGSSTRHGGQLQVFFPFVIFKAATLKWPIFGTSSSSSTTTPSRWSCSRCVHLQVLTSPTWSYDQSSWAEEKIVRQAPPRGSYCYHDHFGIFAKCS